MKTLSNYFNHSTLSNSILNIGIALISLWLAIIFYAYLTGISGLLTIREYVFDPWQFIVWATIYNWTPWVLLVPLVFYLSNRIPILPDNLLQAILKHVALMFVLSLIHGYLSAILYYQIGIVDADMASYAVWQHTGHFLFMDDMFLIDAFIYTSLAASQNIKRFYSLVQQNEMKTMRMQSQLSESKLQALKMQINPHFLFNTLNSISVLIKKKELNNADSMINKLSDFFRQTLEQGHEQQTSLDKELLLIKKYLEIEQIRFGDRLTIEYQIDPKCLHIQVPLLILQPLVENAIKHGLSKKIGHCHLLISAQWSPTLMKLLVVDNGIGTESSVEIFQGLGLKNVQDRLLGFYGSSHQFSFDSSPATGTKITLAFPLTPNLT